MSTNSKKQYNTRTTHFTGIVYLKQGQEDMLSLVFPEKVPELSPNTGSIEFLRIIMLMIPSLTILTISLYNSSFGQLDTFYDYESRLLSKHVRIDVLNNILNFSSQSSHLSCTPSRVYCEIYPSLEGNAENLNCNMPYLRRKTY